MAHHRHTLGGMGQRMIHLLRGMLGIAGDGLACK